VKEIFSLIDPIVISKRQKVRGGFHVRLVHTEKLQICAPSAELRINRVPGMQHQVRIRLLDHTGELILRSRSGSGLGKDDKTQITFCLQGAKTFTRGDDSLTAC